MVGEKKLHFRRDSQHVFWRGWHLSLDNPVALCPCPWIVHSGSDLASFVPVAVNMMRLSILLYSLMMVARLHIVFPFPVIAFTITEIIQIIPEKEKIIPVIFSPIPDIVISNCRLMVAKCRIGLLSLIPVSFSCICSTQYP